MLAVLTPAEMLSAIRSALMLSVSDVSRVFCVTRSTVYEWATLTGFNNVHPHAARERMKELYDLSQEWVQLGQLTGQWASHALPSGVKVIDLLSAATIDRKAILAAHAQLLAASNSLREAEAIRAINAAKAMGPAFEKLAALQEKRSRQCS